MSEEWRVYMHPEGKMWAVRERMGGTIDTMWGKTQRVTSQGRDGFVFSQRKDGMDKSFWGTIDQKERKGYALVGTYELAQGQHLVVARDAWANEPEPQPEPPRQQRLPAPELDSNAIGKAGLTPIGF